VDLEEGAAWLESQAESASSSAKLFVRQVAQERCCSRFAEGFASPAIINLQMSVNFGSSISGAATNFSDKRRVTSLSAFATWIKSQSRHRVYLSATEEISAELRTTMASKHSRDGKHSCLAPGGRH